MFTDYGQILHIRSHYFTLSLSQRVVIIVIHAETVIQRERGRFKQTDQNKAEMEAGATSAPHASAVCLST